MDYEKWTGLALREMSALPLNARCAWVLPLRGTFGPCILARAPLRAPCATPTPWPPQRIEPFQCHSNAAFDLAWMKGGPPCPDLTLTTTCRWTAPGRPPPLNRAMVSPMQTTKSVPALSTPDQPFADWMPSAFHR